MTWKSSVRKIGLPFVDQHISLKKLNSETEFFPEDFLNTCISLVNISLEVYIYHPILITLL